MKRRFFAALLTLALLLGAAAALAVGAAEAEATPADTKVATDGTTEYTLAGLLALMGADGFTGEGLTLTLTQDITVTDWTSVAVFSGTLDGAGHRIAGLNAPLFAVLSGATVKNLTLEGTLLDAAATGEVNIGLLAKEATGTVTVTACSAMGSIAVCTETVNVNMGAFFGKSATLVMTDCVSSVALTGAKNDRKEASGKHFYVGALVGTAKGDLTALRCVNNGEIYVNTTGNNLVGGLVGQHTAAGSGKAVQFTRCANHAAVTCPNGSGGSKAGGIIGLGNDKNTTYSFTGCMNSGSLSAVNMAAGMLADGRGTARIDGCYNFGSVSVSAAGKVNAFAAGIVGQFYGLTDLPTLKNCGNFGAVSAAGTSTSGFAGGIVAVTSVNVAEFENNINKGAVSCTANYAGGMLARLNSGTSDMTFGHCLSLAPVTGKNVGGILGQISNAGAVVFNGSFCLDSQAQVVWYNPKNAKYTVDGESADKAALNAAVRRAEGEILAAQKVGALAAQTGAAADGRFPVRFLAGLSETEGYSKVGFEVIRLEENGAPSSVVRRESGIVYRSVLGYDENGVQKAYTGAELAEGQTWQYLAALTVTGVPADRTVTFLVRPYLLSSDGTTAGYGAASYVTLQAQ